jgi:hypothetical protein
MSCLEEVKRPQHSRVRLAILLFIQRDLLEQCRVWMHYYTRVERMKPHDIYVLSHDANTELRHCFDALPKRNVIELPPGSRRLPKSLLNSTESLSRSSRSAATQRRQPFTEAYKMQAMMALQRELLASSYTHTLTADLDELLMADPKQYSSLVDYLRRNPQHRTSAPAHVRHGTHAQPSLLARYGALVARAQMWDPSIPCQAFEVQMSDTEEAALNWSAVPLLRGQRRYMVPM